MVREKTINPIYLEKTKTCEFNLNSSKTHDLYSETGFKQTELEVYESASLTKLLKVVNPNYNDEELK